MVLEARKTPSTFVVQGQFSVQADFDHELVVAGAARQQPPLAEHRLQPVVPEVP